MRRQQAAKSAEQLGNCLVAAGESDQSRFELIFAKWVSRDMRPVSIVNDPGFHEAIEYANSVEKKLAVPSRQTVSLRVHRNADGSRVELRVRLDDDQECDFFQFLRIYERLWRIKASLALLSTTMMSLST